MIKIDILNSNFEISIIDFIMDNFQETRIINIINDNMDDFEEYMNKTNTAIEMLEWIKNNIKGHIKRVKFESSDCIFKYDLEFSNDEDATLFKLVWG